MPSTYTLNNGIELIATGEQSGTWGDTTNLNLGLVDTALDGQVTVTLPAAGTSGAPNALPISDGSASDGRNRLIIFADGGDLGATAFVQLTPNDAEKIVYIRNNLSGGRAIALFQGTYNAANDYEVPAGTTAVVFFNGGGAGAVAANVFNNAFFDSLRLGGVSVTAILDEDNMASDSATALATQQSIKAYVDAQVGANNELSEVLANGNTSGGTDIQMTTTDEVQFRDTALTIKSSVDGQLDIAADVELEIVAPTLDINASTAVTIDTTTLTMTGSVNVVGDLDVDNLNLNGNTIISTNTDGNIALTPNGTGEVDISKVDIDGGTIDGTVIGGTTPAAISGTTGSFSGNLTVDTNTLFVDAANNRVGIGTSSPTANRKLDAVMSDNASAGIRVTNSNGGISASSNTSYSNGTTNHEFGILGTAYATYGVLEASEAYVYGSSQNISFAADGASSIKFGTGAGVPERLRIDASGNLLVGKTSASSTIAGVQAISDGRLFATVSNDHTLIGNRLSSDGAIATFQKDNTTVGSIASKDGDLAIGTGTIGVRFLDGSSAIVPQNHSTNSGTDGLLDLGVGAARFKDLYLSGGVYLGGTGSANLLDDYEEGDYDATVTCSTSGTVTLEAASNRASYTKVGRLVTVTGLLIVDSISSPVGYAVISLPFAAATGTDRMADSAASVVLEASLSVNLGDFLATVNEGSASLYLLLGNSTSWSGSNSAGQLSPATQITFSVTYITP